MSSSPIRSSAPRPSRRRPLRRSRSWWQRSGPLLDILMLLAWGAMLVKFGVTGQINVLLHPDYMWLSHSAAVVLLVLAGVRVSQRWRSPASIEASPAHISLFPPGVGTMILLGVALLGLLYVPQPFASETALARGVSETLAATRSQPQSFSNVTRPEERSLIGWVRTLNVYPEPDAYTGQPANVDGFVVHDPNLPDDYLLLSRFIITCCAADAYPVGMPVQLTASRTAYAPDTWLAVTGTMATATLNGDRRLVLVAETLTPIPAPRNPYDY